MISRIVHNLQTNARSAVNRHSVLHNNCYCINILTRDPAHHNKDNMTHITENHLTTFFLYKFLFYKLHSLRLILEMWKCRSSIILLSQHLVEVGLPASLIALISNEVPCDLSFFVIIVSSHVTHTPWSDHSLCTYTHQVIWIGSSVCLVCFNYK